MTRLERRADTIVALLQQLLDAVRPPEKPQAVPPVRPGDKPHAAAQATAPAAKKQAKP